jgi:hypothetical protein
MTHNRMMEGIKNGKSWKVTEREILWGETSYWGLFNH